MRISDWSSDVCSSDLEDHFINRFATMMRLSPIMPVIAPGAKFQPVYVGDVADAVVAALASDAAGKTYELGGPQVLTMGELLRWIADATGRSPLDRKSTRLHSSH